MDNIEEFMMNKWNEELARISTTLTNQSSLVNLEEVQEVGQRMEKHAQTMHEIFLDAFSKGLDPKQILNCIPDNPLTIGDKHHTSIHHIIEEDYRIALNAYLEILDSVEEKKNYLREALSVQTVPWYCCIGDPIESNKCMWKEYCEDAREKLAKEIIENDKRSIENDSNIGKGYFIEAYGQDWWERSDGEEPDMYPQDFGVVGVLLNSKDIKHLEEKKSQIEQDFCKQEERRVDYYFSFNEYQVPIFGEKDPTNDKLYYLLQKPDALYTDKKLAEQRAEILNWAETTLLEGPYVESYSVTECEPGILRDEFEEYSIIPSDKNSKGLSFSIGEHPSFKNFTKEIKEMAKKDMESDLIATTAKMEEEKETTNNNVRQ